MLVDKDNLLGNDTYLMSNQDEDAIDSSFDYQALNEDWDDIFRGKLHLSAGCVEEEEATQMNFSLQQESGKQLRLMIKHLILKCS